MKKHWCYEAFDGTTFSSKEECEAYEAEKNVTPESRALMLSSFESYPPMPDDINDTWRWFLLESEEDLEAIKQVFFTEDATAYEYIVKQPYPVWVVAIHDGYGNGIIMTKQEVELEYLGFLENIQVEISKCCNGNQNRKERTE